jgi:hypothetical protein
VLTGIAIAGRRSLRDGKLKQRQPGGSERGRDGAGERGDLGVLYRRGGALD